jgi:hypothetical protein
MAYCQLIDKLFVIMPAIYLLKLYKLNICNLHLALLSQSLADCVFGPCSYAVDGQGFISVSVGDFVNSQCQNPVTEFRVKDWQASLDQLTASVELAASNNQILLFGSYRSDQTEFLKNYFASEILTIGINYPTDLYESLLRHKSRHHIHLLKTSGLMATDLDKALLSELSEDQLTQYYAHAFDQQNLVARSASGDCDYNIPLVDFFNKSALVQHFTALGTPFTQFSDNFYHQWVHSINFS